MATPAQITANRKNAQHSTGPTSPEGLLAAMRNNLGHGLCSNENFYMLPEENRDAFEALLSRLNTEQNPQNETETILVRRMAQSEWLVARALRLQGAALNNLDSKGDSTKLALYIRYQTTHERSFYKALNELQNLRKQETKAEIGFASQKLKQAAQNCAVDALNLKKEEFQFKKEVFQTKKCALTVVPVPEKSPGRLEMAA